MWTELTKRERQVVQLVARGLSNGKIADALDLVEGTIKIHLYHVYRKLGVPNRTTLVLELHKQKQKAQSLNNHRQFKKRRLRSQTAA